MRASKFSIIAAFSALLNAGYANARVETVTEPRVTRHISLQEAIDLKFAG